MLRRQTVRTAAFTLVELLVVIAIIGILVALLLPAVQAAREAARRSQCSNNLKQIGLGILNYESSHGELPPGTQVTSPGNWANGMATWTVAILPNMEQQAVYDAWNPDVQLSHDDNRALRETPMPGYLCPTDVQDEQLMDPKGIGPGAGKLWAIGSYKGNAGRATGEDSSYYWDDARIDNLNNVPRSAMPKEWIGPLPVTITGSKQRSELVPVKLRKVTDGTSNTLMVGEYHTPPQPEDDAQRRVFWAYGYASTNLSGGFPESRTLLADYDRCLKIPTSLADTCKRAWGSMHPTGIIQFVSIDGSVDSISPDIDMEVFAGRCSIQGGELAGTP